MYSEILAEETPNGIEPERTQRVSTSKEMSKLTPQGKSVETQQKGRYSFRINGMEVYYILSGIYHRFIRFCLN